VRVDAEALPPDRILTPQIEQLSIIDKGMTVRRLEVNWAQRLYLAAAAHQLRTTGRIRLIVLKARQLGISTITEALLFTLAFIIPKYRGLVVTHEVKASQNLLAMTQFYWDTYPYRSLYTTRFLSRNDIAWRETGSSIRIDTAGKKGSEGVGRSSTVHFAHLSEYAFWDDPETVMLGLRQTIPSTVGTGIVVESTPNGVGNHYHSLWLEAEAGESEFIPLFFPWWKHPEYRASALNLPVRELGRSELTVDERALRRLGLDDDRLLWRRWAIKELAGGDEHLFRQEYPATAEEGFLSTGLNVFAVDKLAAVSDITDGIRCELSPGVGKPEPLVLPHGRLTIFKRPSPKHSGWGEYLVAGDPTHTMTGDYACVQVLNRRTLEQVAEWRGKVDPGTFAEVLFSVGSYYNEALVSCEIEGPGYMTIGKLLGMNYPRVWLKARPDRTPGKVAADQYGWSTTAQSKQLMIGALLKYITDGSVIFHSRTLVNELRDYVTLPDGGFGPANPKGHDDTVMAMAQAVAVHMLEGPVGFFDGATPQPQRIVTPGSPEWMEW